MLPLIRKEIQNQADELRRQFLSNDPFPHLAIDDFLDADFCCYLIREFPAFDRQHAQNELGEVGGKAVFQELARLGPAYGAFDSMIRSGEFLSFLSRLTGIPKLLYDPEYVGGGTHENLAGQELDPHVDFNYHPKTNLHRRLNLILYLNENWKPEWGGSLELHLNPWLPRGEDRVRSIEPLANRCVIFETSERSWHGFRKIEIPSEYAGVSRRSIAVYFYTRERPAQETAPPHSTVYAPRPLPEHLKPGHVLREEDLEALTVLLARRDMQIRFLYEREVEFSSALAALPRSFSFRLGRALTWPARRAARLLGIRRN